MSTKLRAVLTLPGEGTVRGGAVLRELKKAYTKHLGSLEGKALPKKTEGQIRFLYNLLTVGCPVWKKGRLFLFWEQTKVSLKQSHYRQRLKCYHFPKKGSKKYVKGVFSSAAQGLEGYELPSGFSPPLPTVLSSNTQQELNSFPALYSQLQGVMGQASSFFQPAQQNSSNQTNPPIQHYNADQSPANDSIFVGEEIA